MKPSPLNLSVLTFLAIMCAIPNARLMAQIPNRLIDAPFTAVQTIDTVQKDGTHRIVTGTVARRRDGSTYTELRNADGSGTIIIYDAATQTGLQCYLGRGICNSFDNGSPNPYPWPMDYVATYFRQWAQFGPKNVQGKSVETFLSRRVLEGVDVAELSMDSGDGRTSQRWYAPALDLNLRLTGHYPADGIEKEARIENLKLGEPEAKLFGIPDGYRKVTMVRGRVQEPPR